MFAVLIHRKVVSLLNLFLTKGLRRAFCALAVILCVVGVTSTSSAWADGPPRSGSAVQARIPYKAAGDSGTLSLCDPSSSVDEPSLLASIIYSENKSNDSADSANLPYTTIANYPKSGNNLPVLCYGILERDNAQQAAGAKLANKLRGLFENGWYAPMPRTTESQVGWQTKAVTDADDGTSKTLHSMISVSEMTVGVTEFADKAIKLGWDAIRTISVPNLLGISESSHNGDNNTSFFSRLFASARENSGIASGAIEMMRYLFFMMIICAILFGAINALGRADLSGAINRFKELVVRVLVIALIIPGSVIIEVAIHSLQPEYSSVERARDSVTNTYIVDTLKLAAFTGMDVDGMGGVDSTYSTSGGGSKSLEPTRDKVMRVATRLDQLTNATYAKAGLDKADKDADAADILAKFKNGQTATVNDYFSMIDAIYGTKVGTTTATNFGGRSVTSGRPGDSAFTLDPAHTFRFAKRDENGVVHSAQEQQAASGENVENKKNERESAIGAASNEAAGKRLSGISSSSSTADIQRAIFGTAGHSSGKNAESVIRNVNPGGAIFKGQRGKLVYDTGSVHNKGKQPSGCEVIAKMDGPAVTKKGGASSKVSGQQSLNRCKVDGKPRFVFIIPMEDIDTGAYTDGMSAGYTTSYRYYVLDDSEVLSAVKPATANAQTNNAAKKVDKQMREKEEGLKNTYNIYGSEFEIDLSNDPNALAPRQVSTDTPSTYLYGAVPATANDDYSLLAANYCYGQAELMSRISPETGKAESDADKGESLKENAIALAALNKFGRARSRDNANLSFQSTAFLLQSDVTDKGLYYSGFNTVSNAAGASKNTGQNGNSFLRYTMPARNASEQAGIASMIASVYTMGAILSLAVVVILFKSQIFGALFKTFSSFAIALFGGSISHAFRYIIYFTAMNMCFLFVNFALQFGLGFSSVMFGTANPFAKSLGGYVNDRAPALMAYFIDGANGYTGIFMFILMCAIAALFVWPMFTVSTAGGKSRKVSILSGIINSPFMIAETLDNKLDGLEERLYGKRGGFGASASFSKPGLGGLPRKMRGQARMARAVARRGSGLAGRSVSLARNGAKAAAVLASGVGAGALAANAARGAGLKAAAKAGAKVTGSKLKADTKGALERRRANKGVPELPPAAARALGIDKMSKEQQQRFMRAVFSDDDPEAAKRIANELADGTDGELGRKFSDEDIRDARAIINKSGSGEVVGMGCDGSMFKGGDDVPAGGGVDVGDAGDTAGASGSNVEVAGASDGGGEAVKAGSGVGASSSSNVGSAPSGRSGVSAGAGAPVAVPVAAGGDDGKRRTRAGGMSHSASARMADPVDDRGPGSSDRSMFDGNPSKERVVKDGARAEAMARDVEDKQPKAQTPPPPAPKPVQVRAQVTESTPVRSSDRSVNDGGGVSRSSERVASGEASRQSAQPVRDSEVRESSVTGAARRPPAPPSERVRTSAATQEAIARTERTKPRK